VGCGIQTWAGIGGCHISVRVSRTRSASRTAPAQGVEGRLLTPAVLTAMVAHRSELDSFFHSPRLSSGVKPLTAEEQRHAEWMKKYLEAQAERLARKAELRNGNEMSEEEFTRELSALDDGE
jgi:hypothetical protein